MVSTDDPVSVFPFGGEVVETFHSSQAYTTQYDVFNVVSQGLYKRAVRCHGSPKVKQRTLWKRSRLAIPLLSLRNEFHAYIQRGDAHVVENTKRFQSTCS